ncbi:uncharacterized protein IAS62_002808 [Cryptococcus decagattii]|uniref:Uncharacterized protein n=1 Tax=Cryptococcus decagattii TaxID=1859122 RepID=A0ABZ2ATB8_9TREE
MITNLFLHVKSLPDSFWRSAHRSSCSIEHGIQFALQGAAGSDSHAIALICLRRKTSINFLGENFKRSNELCTVDCD